MGRTQLIITALAELTSDELEQITGLTVTPGRLEIDDSEALDEIRNSILDDVRHVVLSAYETGNVDPDHPTDRANELSAGLRRVYRSNDYAVLDNAQKLTLSDFSGEPIDPQRMVRDLVDEVVQYVYDAAVAALIDHIERTVDKTNSEVDDEISDSDDSEDAD